MREHGTKTTPFFYLLMEKPLGCYLQDQSPYYQAEPENIYSRILKVTGHVSESKRVKHQH